MNRGKLQDLQLTLLGFGALGETLVRSLINTGQCAAHRIVVIERDPSRHARAMEISGIRVRSEPDRDVSGTHVVMLAVKPQDAKGACASLNPYLTGQQLVISFIAGVSCAALQLWMPILASGGNLARAMPNLPVKCSQSATAVFVSPDGDNETRGVVNEVLRSFGAVLEIEEEALLDAVTAVSGSGPAYFLALVEALEAVGQELGLSRSQARALVRQTALGTAQLLQEEHADPVTLRGMVTSPNGTTAAAFSHLDREKWDEVLKEAVRKAARRATELGLISEE